MKYEFEVVIEISSFCGKHLYCLLLYGGKYWKISEKPELNDTYDFPKNRRYFKREGCFTSMASKQVRE